jgi:hypothetical protein
VTDIRLQRPPRLASLLWIGFFAAHGCAFNTWVPGERMEVQKMEQEQHDPVIAFEPGSTQQGSLDCPAGRCNVRYRVDMHEPGDLRVKIASRFAHKDVMVRLVIEDPAGPVLAETEVEDDPVVRLSTPVSVGPYNVLVQSIGGRMDYDLTIATRRGEGRQRPTATRRPRPTPETDRVDRALRGGKDHHYDPKIDFTTYKSFAFAVVPEDQLKAQPGARVGDPFLLAELQRAVQSELLGRGYQPVDRKQADFLLNLHVGGRSTPFYYVDAVRYDYSYSRYYSSWYGGGAGVFVVPFTYQEGTLVIDIIDVRLKELTWYGWSTEEVGNRVSRQEVVRHIVHNILDDFPPVPLRVPKEEEAAAGPPLP